MPASSTSWPIARSRPLPPELLRALRFVGPAVLSALLVSLLASGEGRSGVDVEEIAAVAAGAGTAALSKNLIAAIAVGMSTLWILGAVL